MKKTILLILLFIAIIDSLFVLLMLKASGKEGERERELGEWKGNREEKEN